MFVLPELRVFRGSILQVLLVLAVMWEDTASIGNILGLCTADILSHYGQLFIVGPLFILIIYFILRALAALVYTLNTLRNSTSSILRCASVHTVVCRLTSVALQFSIQRTDHQLAASGKAWPYIARLSILSGSCVTTGESPAGIQIHKYRVRNKQCVEQTAV